MANGFRKARVHAFLNVLHEAAYLPNALLPGYKDGVQPSEGNRQGVTPSRPRSILAPALILSLAQFWLVAETPIYSHQHTQLPSLASLGYTAVLLLRCWKPAQRVWQQATDVALIWLLIWLATAFGFDFSRFMGDALWLFMLVSPSCLLGLSVFLSRPNSPLECSMLNALGLEGPPTTGTAYRSHVFWILGKAVGVLLATSWQMAMLSLPLTQRSFDFHALFQISLGTFFGLSLVKVIKPDSTRLALAWRSSCWVCGLTAFAAMLPVEYEKGIGPGTVWTLVTDVFLLLLPLWMVRVCLRETSRPATGQGGPTL